MTLRTWLVNSSLLLGFSHCLLCKNPLRNCCAHVQAVTAGVRLGNHVLPEGVVQMGQVKIHDVVPSKGVPDEPSMSHTHPRDGEPQQSTGLALSSDQLTPKGKRPAPHRCLFKEHEGGGLATACSVGQRCHIQGARQQRWWRRWPSVISSVSA